MKDKRRSAVKCCASHVLPHHLAVPYSITTKTTTTTQTVLSDHVDPCVPWVCHNLELGTFSSQVIEKQLGTRNPLGMNTACQTYKKLNREATANLHNIKCKNIFQGFRVRKILCTWNAEDDITQLISRLEIVVFLNELCQWEVDMILVWVRVFRSSLQVLDGLGADLEVLLHIQWTIAIRAINDKSNKQ